MSGPNPTPNFSSPWYRPLYNFVDHATCFEGPFKIENMLCVVGELASKIGYKSEVFQTFAIGRNCTVIPKILGDLKGLSKAIQKIIQKQGLGEYFEVVYQCNELTSSAFYFSKLIGAGSEYFNLTKVLGVTNDTIDLVKSVQECREFYPKIDSYNKKVVKHSQNPKKHEHPIFSASFKHKNPEEVVRYNALKISGKLLSLFSGIIAIVGLVTGAAFVSNTILLTMSAASIILAFTAKGVKSMYSFELYRQNDEKGQGYLNK